MQYMKYIILRTIVGTVILLFIAIFSWGVACMPFCLIEWIQKTSFYQYIKTHERSHKVMLWIQKIADIVCIILLCLMLWVIISVIGGEVIERIM